MSNMACESLGKVLRQGKFGWDDGRFSRKSIPPGNGGPTRPELQKSSRRATALGSSCPLILTVDPSSLISGVE